MWPKFLNSKWFERLFTAAITIICLLLGQALVANREGKTALKRELKDMATIKYVDDHDAEIKNDLLKSDEKLKKDLDNTVVEFNTNLREVRNYIYSISNKNGGGK